MGNLPRPLLNCDYVLPSAKQIAVQWRIENPAAAAQLDAMEMQRIMMRAHVQRPATPLMDCGPSHGSGFITGVMFGIILTCLILWSFK